MEINTTLHAKLLAFQKLASAIKKNAENPFYHSKYFDINGLLQNIKPELNDLGLTINQPIIVEEGKNVLLSIISDGTDRIESKIVLPDIQDPQKFGSVITYFRRYALQSMLALEAEDDDGNSASNVNKGKKTIPIRALEMNVCVVCGKEHAGDYAKCIDCYRKGV